ncbi:hypothetical protein CS0771_43170 [Catellatospora sp. IY07-71]|uniref:hypothetical protein n=1 Tax=Catellatospora sp. IY07-71 TaxID=2728827 RepID=UPI001BB3E1CF|nr:hypothetical protein [Catellatospora sp. IY07-71]BCJ74773.1 hypothetical protein CS0771_43170 [Catellatospora sp. IY07-71]
MDHGRTSAPPAAGPHGRRLRAGIALALGAHLATILVAWPLALFYPKEAVDGGFGEHPAPLDVYLPALISGQAVLATVALGCGIAGAVRRERGTGLGVLTGWAAGLLLCPGAAYFVGLTLVRIY